jgi:hypothetical protein
MNPNLTSMDVIVNSMYGAEQKNSYIDFTDLPVKFSVSQMILC